MAIRLLDSSGKPTGNVELSDVFAAKPKRSLLHQAVVRHLANRRAGTADTKTRDEVAGGGRKPWRQKGTGRARHGSIRSPIWRKGGVVFGPHPRSFAIGMNKKARRRALAMAIGAKAGTDSLAVLDAADLAPAKTKELVPVLWPPDSAAQTVRVHPRVLLVLDRERDKSAAAIERAARNLKQVTVAGHGEVSAHSLLAHERVILTKNAYEALAQVCRG